MNSCKLSPYFANERSRSHDAVQNVRKYEFDGVTSHLINLYLPITEKVFDLCSTYLYKRSSNSLLIQNNPNHKQFHHLSTLLFLPHTKHTIFKCTISPSAWVTPCWPRGPVRSAVPLLARPCLSVVVPSPCPRSLPRASALPAAISRAPRAARWIPIGVRLYRRRRPPASTRPAPLLPRGPTLQNTANINS